MNPQLESFAAVERGLRADGALRQSFVRRMRPDHRTGDGRRNRQSTIVALAETQSPHRSLQQRVGAVRPAHPEGRAD